MLRGVRMGVAGYLRVWTDAVLLDREASTWRMKITGRNAGLNDTFEFLLMLSNLSPI
jgi:hypothetical protein